MKAIRVHEFGGPEVMKLEEVPDLTAGPGQVVVSVKAAGVNPADTYIAHGRLCSKAFAALYAGHGRGGDVCWPWVKAWKTSG